MDRQPLDSKTQEWLKALPAFVQAVTVEGEHLVEGTGVPFEPEDWKAGLSIEGWEVWEVTAHSVRFKRRNALLDDRPLPSY